MPGLDRKFDHFIGDYVDDGEGGYTETITVETAAYLQITIERDDWLVDATRGSDVHLLPQRNADAATVLAAQKTLQSALQRLVDAGLAKDLFVEVAIQDNLPGRLCGITEITDVQAGPIDLSEVVGFGKSK